MVLSHTADASVESHVGFERLGIENILGWWEKGENGVVNGVVSGVNLQWPKMERMNRLLKVQAAPPTMPVFIASVLPSLLQGQAASEPSIICLWHRGQKP